MNSTNYGYGWNASNRYWFRRTRTLLARLLTWGGHRSVDMAEQIAPWLRTREHAERQPMPWEGY